MQGMTALHLMCVLLLAGLYVTFEPKGLAQRPPLVIEGGTLIDGAGTAPRRDAVIVIEGNKITAVGEKGKVSYPQGARIIPAAGKFILPGLIDMHVHWDNWMPELFLAHGVTSAVDLNSSDWQLAQKEALASGRMTGPRLFGATPALSGRLLWDLSRTQPLGDAQMARELIRKVGPGRSPYALAKAYTELTPDQLQAVVEESHKAGRRVIAHLGSLDARQAAELGVDAVAHASGIALATISDPVKAEELRTFARLGIAAAFPLYLMYHAFMDPAKVDDLIALLVRTNLRIETDLITTSRWASQQWPDFLVEETRLLQDLNLRYVPAENRERILYDASKRLDPRQREQLRRGYENLQGFIRKFVRAGGTILAGCDSASFVLPGLCLHQELVLLVDAGLTPLQAIQAATKNNAEFLQESELGTIEPGKLADLIMVREDPLADIKNTRTVEVVVKDGNVMDTRYHPDFANPIPRTSRPGRFVNPEPFLRAIFPMQSRELNKDVPLTLEGSNFVDESVVELEGVEIPTTPIRDRMVRETAFDPIYTQLTATIPGRLLSRTGTYKVIVKNPKPEGGTSSVLHFFVAP